MAWAVTAVAGATLVGGYLASESQADAASSAAGAQQASSEASIAEQRRQFNKVQELLKPYVDAGTSAITGLKPYEAVGKDALTQERNLIGLNGAGAQQAAIAALAGSPEMAAYMKQGENAILQNASATGGLRGGNVQGALAEFRPALLAELINKQYGRLGGLTQLGAQTTGNIAQLGQASAAGTASAAQNAATGISNALQQSGAAQAGAYLAQGQAEAGMWNNISGTASMLGTLKLLGKF